MNYRLKLKGREADGPTIEHHCSVNAVSRKHANDKGLRIAGSYWPDAVERSSEIIGETPRTPREHEAYKLNRCTRCGEDLRYTPTGYRHGCGKLEKI